MLTVKILQRRKDNTVLNLDCEMGVYKIVNNITGDCYVGQSVNIPKRIIEHFRTDRKKPSRVQKQVKEYGKENFSVIILEECKTHEELDEREIYWISVLKPSLNVQSGGRQNHLFRHTESTIEDLRFQGKEWYANLPNEKKQEIISRLKGPAIGHPVSKATRAKLSAARAKQDLYTPEIAEKRRKTLERKKEEGWVKAKPKEPMRRMPIFCIETGEHFNNMSHASAVMGISRDQIRRQLNGKVAKAKGYSFSREV